MKKMKKLALWLMMLVLVFSLAACGEKEEDDAKSNREERVEQRDDDEDDKDSEKDEDESKDKSEEDKGADAKDEDKDVVAEPDSNKADVELVLDKMYEAANANGAISQANTDMVLKMSLSMTGATFDIDMVSSGKTMLQMNPYISYTYSEMTMEMLGEQQTMVTESYVISENGDLVTYSYDGSTGVWSKTDTGMSEADVTNQSTNYAWMKEKPVSDYTLDTQLYNIGGRDAYKLEFEFTGEEMNQSLSGMPGVTDMLSENGMGDIDMSALSVPTVYYIDAENYQILQMECNIEGMGEWLNDMMELLGADLTTAGYEMDLNIEKCSMLYTDISYEPVEIPALPAEATGEQDIVEPDISVEPGVTEVDPGTTEVQPEGGVYTIEESGISAQITCPEGWTVLYSAYDTLEIENDETWQEAEFVMYIDVTSEDFVSYVEDMVVPELQQYEGMYVSHGAGPQMGAFETMEVLGDGLNFFFAWAPVGEGWILVNVTDFEGLSMEEALPPILELVDFGDVL